MSLHPYAFERRMYHSYTKILARTTTKNIPVAIGVCDSGAISPKIPAARPENKAHTASITPVRMKVFLMNLPTVIFHSRLALVSNNSIELV